ncbi:uncharacterized protein [Linepithema humile]|uniref:uncharacterized protein n=1 Tax=Linepithema humile TaxID=83485 RepID=UPI00351EBB54
MEEATKQFIDRYWNLAAWISRRFPDFWDDLAAALGRPVTPNTTAPEAREPDVPETRTGQTVETEERSRQQPIPRAGVEPRFPTGCWNCGGPHRYARCWETRSRFCYGCGTRGATVRTCENCGPTYDPEAPHQSQKGPRRATRGPTVEATTATASTSDSISDSEAETVYFVMEDWEPPSSEEETPGKRNGDLPRRGRGRGRVPARDIDLPRRGRGRGRVSAQMRSIGRA